MSAQIWLCIVVIKIQHTFWLGNVMTNVSGREKEKAYVYLRSEKCPVYFLLDQEILKTCIYTCQLLSNVDGIVCYFSLWDFISCGFPCQESCSIFPAHCRLQVSGVHSFQYCVCSSMWCPCTVQYCFSFEHRFWRNLCILSSTGLSKDLPYYRADALELMTCPELLLTFLLSSSLHYRKSLQAAFCLIHLPDIQTWVGKQAGKWFSS